MEALMLQITSASNPKLKQALALRDRRDRDETGLFLIEGFREISRALSGQVRIVQLFICEELFLGSHEKELLAQSKEAAIIQVPIHLFRKLSYRDRPD